MPIYEYLCRDCRSRTEKFFVSYQASIGLPAECGACGSINVKKLISPVTVKRKYDWTAALEDPALRQIEGGHDSGSLASAIRAAGRALDDSFDLDWQAMADRLESGDTAGKVEIAPPEGFPEPGPDAQAPD